jgi:type I restriction enzyme S subunit
MTVTTLGEIADWGSGGTPKRSNPAYFGVGTPWLSIADLNDGYVSAAKESLTKLGIANSSAKVVPKGTLLIAMYGSIGKLGIAEVELCTSQAIAHAKPKADKVLVRYLFHFLLSQRHLLIQKGRGGTQMNIGQADLKSWRIDLPTLDEQLEIVSKLDKVIVLKEAHEAQVSRLAELYQSLQTKFMG